MKKLIFVVGLWLGFELGGSVTVYLHRRNTDPAFRALSPIKAFWTLEKESFTFGAKWGEKLSKKLIYSYLEGPSSSSRY